jgi:hypothetical protein
MWMFLKIFIEYQIKKEIRIIIKKSDYLWQNINIHICEEKIIKGNYLKEKKRNLWAEKIIKKIKNIKW